MGASGPAPWRPQVYMTLIWTHSALIPPGAKNCMDILKKSGKSKLWPSFSSSLMKRVLHFMRSPKLAHILVLFISSRLLFYINILPNWVLGWLCATSWWLVAQCYCYGGWGCQLVVLFKYELLAASYQLCYCYDCHGNGLAHCSINKH